MSSKRRRYVVPAREVLVVPTARQPSKQRVRYEKLGWRWVMCSCGVREDGYFDETYFERER